MKTLKLLILAMIFTVAAPTNAQTADEIINTYIENIGGKKDWNKVNSLKFIGKVKIPSQGLDLPILGINLKDGKQIMSAEFQGMTFVQQAYDGESAWATNQMTMKPEKSDSETTENLKRSFSEFPDPLLNYKDKGFKIELVGKETVDGTETFKIKLTKTPLMVDGKEEESVTHYFFDTENFVPIMTETVAVSGPFKGTKSQTYFSDYQEVNGLYFSMSMEVKTNGQVFQSISFDKIEVNPDIDNTIFKMPEPVATPEVKQ